MSKAIYGTVQLTVGDHSFTLKPTLQAVLKIEQRFGGLRPALEVCNMQNVEASSFIIAAGASLKEEQIKALPEQVFQAGIVQVTAQVIPYLTLLMRPTAGLDEDQGNAEAASTAQ